MCLFFMVVAIAYPCHYAAAQTEEEMKVLSMFYKEEELVVTPTRHPKPISQVAENITVITSEEIEAVSNTSLSAAGLVSRIKVLAS